MKQSDFFAGSDITRWSKYILLMCVLVAGIISTSLWGEVPARNILVSSDQVLYEYTLDGVYVRDVVIPTAPGCCGESRDLIAVGDQSVAVYNGTFSPLLSTYDFGTATWAEQSVPGWSTVNNVSYGGITFYDGAVYATDMYTYNGGETRGIVRFDPDGVTVDWYFPNNDYIDISLGLDGKMYALRNVYGDLEVIDPSSMTLLTTLDLGHTRSIRATAVNANGEIFAASWDDNVYHFDNSGLLLSSIDSTLDDLTDIDIDSTGTLIIGCRFGQVAVTDEAFSFIRVIDILGTSQPTFVAFAPVPVTSGFHPWQENENGDLRTGINWDYAMGYHFTPLVDGVITKLGGFFNGTKKVRLFNKSTGEMLAEVMVTAKEDWQFAEITPVKVSNDVTYTVAVYLAGSGASYRYNIDWFPQDYGDIRIEGSTYAYTGYDPDLRPTNTITSYMFGQADIEFVPGR